MSRAEQRAAWTWALVIAGILSAPYLFAWGITPPERAYLGHLWNPDEPNVYYSWINQAAHGRVFLEDLFTTEPQHGRFTNVFLLALGWAAAITRLPVPWVYALARFACAAFLYYSLYAFVARRGGSPVVRRAAVALAATASGLGWVLALPGAGAFVPGGVSAVDVGLASAGGAISEGLMMPEANTVASALLLPLFSFSMALLLWLVGIGTEAIERGDLARGARAGLLGLVLGSVHTYDVIPMHLLLGLMALGFALRRRTLRPLWVYGVYVALSLPTLLYQLWVFRVDRVFHDKAVTVTASPSPLSYAVSFGLPLLFALCGLAVVRRRREARWTPVAVWLLVGLAVAFLPGLSFQRKMIEGAHLPMVILAAVALVRGPAARGARLSLAAYRRRACAWAVAGVLACAPSSATFLCGRCLASVLENNRSRVSYFMPPYMLARDDLAALLWLRENAGSDDAVLCLPFLGSYVPGLTGRKAYCGHWAETLRFAEEKLPATLGALRGDARRGARALAACDYLVVGEYENPHGARPGGPDLTPVFSSGATTVYRIEHGPNPTAEAGAG